jgi:hypothetical protein
MMTCGIMTYRGVQSAAVRRAAALRVRPGPGSVLIQAGAVDGASLTSVYDAGASLGNGGHGACEGEGEGDDKTHGDNFGGVVGYLAVI